MASDHKLTGCISRFRSQLDRSREFLRLAATVIPDDDTDPNRQYLYKSTILMVQSFFEEYLRSIVATATFYKTPSVRLHLAEGQKDPDQFAVMNMAEVSRAAQDRVKFEHGARQLKRLFGVLTGGSPFASDDAEQKCLDWANVRNIIAHAGGWPTKAHLPIVKSPNVIVESNQINGITFLSLTINRQFFGETLLGMGLSVDSLETRVATDPEVSL
jgi:hypothetical protein